MYARDLGQRRLPEGLHIIRADFYTEHLSVRGELSVIESRVSDHLNGAATSVEVKPLRVTEISSGREIDLLGSNAAHLTKTHLLFILPIDEPETLARADNIAWEWKMVRQCQAAVGRYSVSAKVQAEAGRDPRLILRSLEEKQFLPLQEATITFPDGRREEFPTVIINRRHLELLAILGGY